MRNARLRPLVYATLLAALLATPALAGGDRHARNASNGSYGDPQRGSSERWGERSDRNFGLDFNPQWQWVPKTRVMVIRDEDRPDYDMFRFNNAYYVYQGGNWYRARHWTGEFRPIDSRQVPTVFRRVPREYWVEYPSSWSDQGNEGNRWNDRERERERRDRERH